MNTYWPSSEEERKNRINQLIQKIKDSDSFDMTRYHHECGTPACIAGHIAELMGLKSLYEGWADDTADWLGISVYLGKDRDMFMPIEPEFDSRASIGQRGHISKSDAVQAFETLRDEGVVRWGPRKGR